MPETGYQKIGTDEDSVDLQAGDSTEQDKDEGFASVPSSTVNFVNSVIGAGVLTLPWCLVQTGYVLGTILFVISAYITSQTFAYMAYAADHTKVYVYKDLAERLLHFPFIGTIMSIIIVIYVAGGLCSYAICLMDNFFWWTDESDKTYRVILMFAILLCLIGPCACLKKLDFLKYNGYITVVAEILICMVIIYYFATSDFEKNEPVAFKLNLTSFYTLPLYQASLCGHFSTTFLYKELKNRGLQKFNFLIALSTAVLLTFYFINMLFGYFTFTDSVSSDLLKTIAQHSSNAWLLRIANVAFLALIICHYPATCYGARRALESLFWPKREAPLWGTVVVVYTTITVLATIGVFVTEIADVLDVTSSLTGSFVVMIFPGLFAYFVNKEKGLTIKDQIIPILIVLAGCFVLVMGIISTAVGWFQ